MSDDERDRARRLGSPRAPDARVIGVTTAHTADELVGAGAERAVPHFETVRWPV